MSRTTTATHKAVMEQLAATWGAAVLARRTELGIHQTGLAVSAATSQQQISKIERGELVPSDPLKLRLATALTTTPAVLFAWPDL